MKTVRLYKILITLLLIPILAFGSNNNDLKGRYTKEKKINKEFSVNPNATLKIDNRYGNIDIITWKENRIEIEVHISTSSNSEENAERKLDQIIVDFNASSSMVSAITQFNTTKSWWNWGIDNVSMKINYTIKMPITNNINLSNKYGNINLDKLEGHATINCKYGKITTKELMADNNSINFKYTNNSYFEYIKSGKIDADYSGFIVGKTNDLEINADYTKSKIEIAENITYNCRYGGITIEKVNNVEGNGKYLTTRIGDVYKNIEISAKYGSFKINNMTKNAGDVFIKSKYTKITIGCVPNYNFNFNIDLDYCSLRDKEDLEITKQNIESHEKYYEGYYGSNTSGNMIRIESDYGSVSLRKN